MLLEKFRCDQRHLVLVMALAACFALLTDAAQGATIHLQFEGSNANVSINGGSTVAGSNWLLEFDVNDGTAATTPANSWIATFPGAMTGGRIQINGVLYQLTGTSSSGQVDLVDFSQVGFTGNMAVVYPSSGGLMRFFTGNGGLFPPLFTDNDSLSSAVLGATTLDATLVGTINASAIDFSGSSQLIAAGSNLISIHELTQSHTGDMRMTISETSAFEAVPEPSTLALLGLGVIGMPCIVRRRRRQPA